MGVLAQYLVEGSVPKVNSELGADDYLELIARSAHRFVEQKHRRTNRSGDNRQSSVGLFFDRSLNRLLGNGHVHQLSKAKCPDAGASKSSEASVPASTAFDGRPACMHKDSGQSCADSFIRRDAPSDVFPGSRVVMPLRTSLAPPISAASSFVHEDSPVSMSPFHQLANLDANAEPSLDIHLRKGPVPGCLVPLDMLDPRDVAMATPIIPDAIARAVYDRSYSTLQFAVSPTDQSQHPPGPSACSSNEARPVSGCDPPP